MKGLSGDEYAARNDMVHALPDRIQAIPDGTPPAPKQSGGLWGTAAPRNEIKFDNGMITFNASCEDFILRIRKREKLEEDKLS